MTPKAQRIAIAEACGWKRLDISSNSPLPYWNDPSGVYVGGGSWTPIPDYLNDLNAMHEAEKVLGTDAQQNRYCAEIAAITWGDPETGHRQVVFNQLTATASQRAEAFLRTLNLWTDEA